MIFETSNIAVHALSLQVVQKLQWYAELLQVTTFCAVILNKNEYWGLAFTREEMFDI